MKVVMYSRYVDGILRGGGRPLAVTWRERGELRLHTVTVEREVLGQEAISVADILDPTLQPVVPRLWDARVIRIERGLIFLRGYESTLSKGRLQEWQCEPLAPDITRQDPQTPA